MIRCYLHLDPDTLDDDRFSLEWGRLKYWLKKTGQWETK
jgi:hypothetical protein